VLDKIFRKASPGVLAEVINRLAIMDWKVSSVNSPHIPSIWVTRNYTVPLHRIFFSLKLKSVAFDGAVLVPA
jgi:hypothetical protein